MKKRFAKAYVEISNICNLKCSFCHGTKRKAAYMQETLFRRTLSELRPYTDFLYFHLMGEPLLHPELENYLKITEEYGFRVIITTNGVLLEERGEALLASSVLHKVNISLHSHEANNTAISLEAYVNRCIAFSKKAGNIIVCFRLWNNGGSNARNDDILTLLHTAYPGEWQTERNGIRLQSGVYLQYADMFEWPDTDADDFGNRRFCYGLRDQLGILCDGTVVPCCLDSEGTIRLGNISEQSLKEILNSDRAIALYRGFTERRAVEELCRRCEYSTRFSRNNPS